MADKLIRLVKQKTYTVKWPAKSKGGRIIGHNSRIVKKGEAVAESLVPELDRALFEDAPKSAEAVAGPAVATPGAEAPGAAKK